MVISKLDNGIVKLFVATADSIITLSPIEWFGADSLCVSDLVKTKMVVGISNMQIITAIKK
jgi:hypothetical protein